MEQIIITAVELCVRSNFHSMHKQKMQSKKENHWRMYTNSNTNTYANKPRIILCGVCIWEQRKSSYKHNETHFFDVCWQKIHTHVNVYVWNENAMIHYVRECEWGSKATEATAYVPYTRVSLPNHILCCDSQTPTYFGWSIILHIITFLGKHVRFATPCRLDIWFQMDVHPGILVFTLITGHRMTYGFLLRFMRGNHINRMNMIFVTLKLIMPLSSDT